MAPRHEARWGADDYGDEAAEADDCDDEVAEADDYGSAMEADDYGDDEKADDYGGDTHVHGVPGQLRRG